MGGEGAGRGGAAGHLVPLTPRVSKELQFLQILHQLDQDKEHQSS